MDVQFDLRGCPATQAPTLLVLLPGANMAPEEFEREGFVAALRQRGLAVDVALADANLSYIYDRSMLQRLHEQVLQPARARGWQRIWLAGISLGGFVALAYTMRHPAEVQGVLALAPYLGRRALLQDIAAAGGPAAWRRNAKPREADDLEHDLWMWLSALPADAPRAPPLWLGYGRDDRFAEAHAQLAALLPPGRVSTAPGGHDWAPWRALWAQWLDRGLLGAHCPA